MASAASDQQWGTTPPIITSMPTEHEKQRAEALLDELRSQGTFESTAETQKRHRVLESLQKIADAFVQKVAKEMFKNNVSVIKRARGKIFTYGSFRLGVFGPGSDIDTLVVVPKFVSREKYFEYFPDLLTSMAPPGAITDLTAVPEAYVPIIKFEFSGISIDLIFSRVIMSELPLEKDWNLKANSILRGLDESEQRSVNGTRVTDEILSLVPEVRTFRDALRAIKLWAQRRAIYANIMGFPGGVAWAMMVARVCQVCPKSSSALVVHKFFEVMSQWPWPDPVQLKWPEDGGLGVRVWNPAIYAGDRYHVMPVITPAYPSMCSTFNITKSALHVIKGEIDRALEITKGIMDPNSRKPWKGLYEKHSFFTADYKYYLSVTSSSTNKEAHKIWSGFVESKVRLIVASLEKQRSIALARPFNKGFNREHLCKTQDEVSKVREGDLNHVVKKTEQVSDDSMAEIAEVATKKTGDTAEKEDADGKNSDEVKKADGDDNKTDDKIEKANPEKSADAAAENGNGDEAQLKPDNKVPAGFEVYTQTHYIGLVLAPGAKSLDLSAEVNDFKNTCFGWEKYQETLADVSSLSIQHVRNFGLPDDVFGDGEVKPSRPMRAKPATPAQPAPDVKKRPASEEHPNPAKRQQTAAAR